MEPFYRRFWSRKSYCWKKAGLGIKPKHALEDVGEESSMTEEATSGAGGAQMQTQQTDPLTDETEPRSVGPIATVVILIYMALATILLVYGLLQFWPTVPLLGEGAAKLSVVTLFSYRLEFTNEVRLLMVVVLSGAIGAMVHALRSFSKYVGSRELLWSWVTYYVLLPFVGATLALLFYLVIRGGFFSSAASVSETSPAGFAALAGLVGLFSEPATQKLRSVAGTLFEEVPPSTDPLTESNEEEDEEEAEE
jgi:hypothetical protein